MKFSALLLATATVASATPSVGPDYQRPAVTTPSAFRDLPGDAGAWKTATPADAFARGAWWKLFADSTLDDLETRALTANQDLHASAARVEQARAAAGLARSTYFPSIALDPSFTRERTSATVDNALPQRQSTTYRGALDSTWELDLFGRVRRLNESARADAAATLATFEAVRLALTADVAANYFSLRALDIELGLVANGIDLRRRALDLVTSRQRAGSATDFDLARSETELAATEAEAAALANRRAALQNALAVLVGEPASSFEFPVLAAAVSIPPGIPAGLPSDLLERRPDIAAAERTLAAANARIGVAKAAFFPAISLTGSAGYASADVDNLFKHDSRIWSIGPSLYLPIFQGGRNRANLARSRAAYEESVANYRQHVLIAFGEVQDALTASRLLADQANAQTRAVASARRGSGLSQKRYDAGFVSYLEVIDAQRTALEVEREEARLAGQRWITHIALIKALGGGWQSSRSVPALSGTLSQLQR
jgi:multidrug efflux system outer membrane protein